MSTQYVNDLVKFAREELPALHHDMQNASTQYTLWSACQRLFNIVSVLLHHNILEAYEKLPPGATLPATPTAIPPPPMIVQPEVAPAMIPGLPGSGIPDIAPAGVAQVVITPTGTRVIPAGGTGPSVVLPPGSAVDLATMTGKPDLPPAAPGVAQVVLPPGGAMPAAVADAIAGHPAPPPPATR
jgi:hypothetical protein